MLIAKGANVNELDNCLSAPIHCASLHGHIPIITMLVANGSDCSLLGMSLFKDISETSGDIPTIISCEMN